MWTKTFLILTLITLNSCNLAELALDAKTKIDEESFRRHKDSGLYHELLHFFRFDETTGYSRTDIFNRMTFLDVNNFNLPIIASSPTGSALDGPNMAIESGSVLESTDFFSFDTNRNLNISFWINQWAAFGGTNYLIDAGNFRVYMLESSGPQLNITFDGVTTSTIFNAFLPNITNWYHISINFDFDNSMAYLYRDGVQVSTASISALNDPSSNSISFFSENGGGSQGNELKIDSFGIWNRMLEESEIQDLYSGNNDLD